MLSVNNLKKIYNGKTVIDRLSFFVSGGDIAVIVGPSGCGKSTLLNIVAGLSYLPRHRRPPLPSAGFRLKKRHWRKSEDESAMCFRKTEFFRG